MVERKNGIDSMSSNVRCKPGDESMMTFTGIQKVHKRLGAQAQNLNLELLCGSVLDGCHRFPPCKHFCVRPPQSAPLVRDEISYYIKTASSICWHRWILDLRIHHMIISKCLHWHIGLKDFEDWGSNAWPTPPYFTHPMDMPCWAFASQSNLGNWTS